MRPFEAYQLTGSVSKASPKAPKDHREHLKTGGLAKDAVSQGRSFSGDAVLQGSARTGKTWFFRSAVLQVAWFLSRVVFGSQTRTTTALEPAPES
jgi:hypothetical protein